MKSIEVKIRLCAPASGVILNNISKLLERYLIRERIGFRRIDVMVKFDDDE